MSKPLKNLREEAAKWLSSRGAKAPKATAAGVGVAATGRQEIQVRDFGPVAVGKFDVRPLTVFAGPSNTGKSWIATLIYALELYRNRLFLSLKWGSETIYSKEELEGILADRRFLNIPESPSKWLDDLSEQDHLLLTKSETTALRGVIMSLGNDMLPNEFFRCYSVADSSGLIRRDRKKASIKFKVFGILHDLDISKKPTGKSSTDSDNDPLRIILPEEISLSFDSQSKHRLLYFLTKVVKNDGEDGDRDEYLNRIRLQVLGAFFRQAIKGHEQLNHARPGSMAYYLPAGRGGVMDAHGALVSALIDRASLVGIRGNQSAPALSGVMGDFLNTLLSITRNGDGGGMPNRVEADILHGKVQIRRPVAGIDYPEFVYQPEGWGENSIRLSSASSMVAELSPVSLFLNHVLNPGDTLILDEPEAHLHPAAQMRLMEEIASWIKTGLRVVLTTHSGWILDSISNMVARAEVKGSWRGDTASVNRRDVGVWSFAPVDLRDPAKGTKMHENLWDREEGGYDTGFYDLSTEMHNDWAGSINRLNHEDSAG